MVRIGEKNYTKKQIDEIANWLGQGEDDGYVYDEDEEDED
tara:strand:- start:242 stop:361 length:120 start_codon:yes stop_codon:yes gene_type:complete